MFSSDSGNGKTWWDVKRRDYPSCAGLVDQHEEMTRELNRLDAEAKGSVEPRRKELVQQINELSQQRTALQRQIFACIRESSRPPSGDGQKGLKRVPEQPPQRDTRPAPVTFDQTVDDCFSKSVPNYRSPDWSRFTPELLRRKGVGQFAQSFGISGVAAEADQALENAIPTRDPRGSYAQFLRNGSRGRPQDPARQKERSGRFFYGYGSYPLPSFWDHDVAGPPAPRQ